MDRQGLLPSCIRNGAELEFVPLPISNVWNLINLKHLFQQASWWKINMFLDTNCILVLLWVAFIFLFFLVYALKILMSDLGLTVGERITTIFKPMATASAPLSASEMERVPGSDIFKYHLQSSVVREKEKHQHSPHASMFSCPSLQKCLLAMG